MRQFIRGLFVLLVLGSPAGVQAQTLGTIAGSVKDATGAVLPGVSVEVASPALIERVRSATTDGAGAYAIVSLPVGTYSVTFTLPGFGTVKREGIEILANFTATINAELKVGQVAETVTVTGESPLVDVQGTITNRAVTPDLIKALPNGGTMYQLAAMMPGVFISGGQDVGGSSGSPVGAQLSTHGGPGSDEVQMLDGLRVGNMMGGSRTQQTLSPLLYDEVDVQLSGQGGDAVSLGVTSNSIPRSGGNTFSGTILANGSGPALQTSNLTDRLQALGLTATATLRKLFDVNGSIGGPLVKDRLWFYVTERYQTNSTYAAGAFFNGNPLPTFGNLARVPTTDQAYNPQYLWDNTGRVTAAVTNKLRINGTAIVQRKWWPYFPGVTAAVSPEANVAITWPGRIYQASGTYTATNRLIFEGGFNFQDSSDLWEPIPFANNVGGNAVRVVEQGATVGGVAIPSVTYGPLSPTLASDNPMHMTDYRGAVNYVTGTHNVKVGMDLQSGSRQNQWLGLSSLIQARTLGYQLNQVTIFAPPGVYTSNLDYDAGIFAQDRWNLKRLTLTGAVRLDLQKESYNASTIGPSLYLPNRPVQTIPGATVTDWKDVNPRFGAAYDVFGNGKTALKFSAARGVAGETIATAALLNPGASFATSTSINVNDANKDNIPQCNFQNPAANGECGPWLTPTFGSAIPLTQQDPATLNGWNKRPWNWEFSAGVQQQISPSLSAGITYFRRIYGNFVVTDNTATTAADYTQYSLTVPTDPRLSTSGQTLTFYDVNPVLKSGQSGLTTTNYNTFASNYGDMFQHWNGFDLTATSRLAGGVTANGGVTFGKALFDDCAVSAQLPEMLYSPTLSPIQMCHFESGWAPQVKLLGSYILPWQTIRISGTFQSLPGPVRQASVLYTQAQVTAALGRPATIAGNKSVNAMEPSFPLAIPPGVGTPFLLGTDFGDRLNQLDLRFSKIFKFGAKTTLDANFDIYNAFNSDAVLSEQAAYSGTNGGAWLLPTSVLQGRIIKFGVRLDF